MCQVPKNDMRNKELLLLGCNVCGCKGIIIISLMEFLYEKIIFVIPKNQYV